MVLEQRQAEFGDYEGLLPSSLSTPKLVDKANARR